jgi:hypothetical protein
MRGRTVPKDKNYRSEQKNFNLPLKILKNSPLAFYKDNYNLIKVLIN